MISIADKFSEIEALQQKLDLKFFENIHKRDREWWVLGKAARILSKSKHEEIKYASEYEPPLPDFQLHYNEVSHFLEVAESPLAGRKRHEELKKRYSGELPAMWSLPTIKDPFVLFRSVIAKKLRKALIYPSDTWLLIYFSINRLQMPGNLGISWERLVFDEIESWRQRNLVSAFGSCRFRRILVLDSSGERLISIFPAFEILHELKGFSP